MKMPGRYGSESNGKYSFGYQGSMMDNEMYSQEGNSYETEYRQLDVRIGRWLSTDSKEAKFPWQSPYVSMDNNPVKLIDPDGQNAILPTKKPKYDDDNQTFVSFRNAIQNIFKPIYKRQKSIATYRRFLNNQERLVLLEHYEPIVRVATAITIQGQVTTKNYAYENGTKKFIFNLIVWVMGL